MTSMRIVVVDDDIHTFCAFQGLPGLLIHGGRRRDA